MSANYATLNSEETSYSVIKKISYESAGVEFLKLQFILNKLH